jgi:hypothetical protein
MTPLITINDIRARKSISLNVNEVAQLTPQILEAQDFDLRPFMGDEFYFALVDDIKASPSLTVYADLWNGCTYTFGGRQYTQEGLKTYLVYASYARYVANASTIATATGLVGKNNQYSEPVTDKTIARITEQTRSGSQVYLNRVTDFLNRNRTDYPLWRVTGCERETPYRAGIKIRQIG